MEHKKEGKGIEIAALIISIVTFVGMIFIGWNQILISNDANALTKNDIAMTVMINKISAQKIADTLGFAFADLSAKDGHVRIRSLYEKTMKEDYERDSLFDQITTVANAFDEMLVIFKENNYDKNIISKLYHDEIVNTYNLMKVDFSDVTMEAIESKYEISAKNYLDFMMISNKKFNEVGISGFIEYAESLINQE